MAQARRKTHTSIARPRAKASAVSKLMAGKSARMLLSVAVAIISALLFFYLLDYPLNGMLKFFVIVGELGLTGSGLQRLLGIEGEWGMLLLRTQKGLRKIDELSRWHPQLWRTFADLGFVFGFGALSLLMYRGIPKKTYAAGLFILLASAYLVLPLVLPIAYSVISNLPTGGISSRSASGTAGELTVYLYLGFLLLVGVAGAGILGLVANAGAIVAAVLGFLGGSGTALASATPGASPIIPGRNIPLLEGIAALVIILVVHESAHGILARLHKIRLKSAGIVLYGILPVGAFVDPDEESLQNAAPEKQRDVLVAGSASNFLACFASIALLLLFIFGTAPLQDKTVLASVYLNSTPVINASSIIEMNRLPIAGPDDILTALSATTQTDLVSMRTSDGRLITMKLDANSSITSLNSVLLSCQQVSCSQFSYEKAGANDATAISVLFTNSKGEPFVPLVTRLGTFVYPNAFKPGWGWLGFIYGTLALSFVLNFLIGSVNLMPIPMFDGHRLFSIAVPHPLAMKLITYTISLAFVLNLLPWAWS